MKIKFKNKLVGLSQARAVVTFLDAASEKTLRSTVALTATRGRGKVCPPQSYAVTTAYVRWSGPHLHADRSKFALPSLDHEHHCSLTERTGWHRGLFMPLVVPLLATSPAVHADAKADACDPPHAMLI